MQKDGSDVEGGEFLPPLKRRESFAILLEVLITLKKEKEEKFSYLYDSHLYLDTLGKIVTASDFFIMCENISEEDFFKILTRNISTDKNFKISSLPEEEIIVKYAEYKLKI
ncbi:MAG: hypothetical protein ACXQTS_06075 [Candidatus Methanospirareceae archaeon]